MASFKQPSFQDRLALAASVKQAALEKLRAKPPVDEAVLAERRKAAELREAAQLKAREEKRAAKALEIAQKKELAAEAAASGEKKAPAKTPEELKQIRDAKYAARKKNTKRR